MTEPRISDLLVSIEAHHDSLVEHSGDYALMHAEILETSSAIRSAASIDQAAFRKMGLGSVAERIEQIASRAEMIAGRLASGLERLSSILQAAEDTVPDMRRSDLGLPDGPADEESGPVVVDPDPG